MDQTDEEQGGSYLLLPTTTGGGALVRRGQVVGARANGPDGGAIIYTAAGPSIYTTLTTRQIAGLFDAQLVEPGPRG